MNTEVAVEQKPLSNFERLAAINVNEQVEKKGGLSYLSWAWAVDRLLRLDPDAEWSYAPVQYFPDRTAMVECTVKAFGKSRTEPLPVMDHRNRAIVEPDAFAINTAMKRCLVKAIALHGLGLYIYAGEDLPPGEKDEKKGAANDDDHQDKKLDPNRPNTARQAMQDIFDAMSAADQKYCVDLATTVIDLVEGGDDAVGYIIAQKLSHELYQGLWLHLPSQVRTAIKKVQAERAAKLKSPKAPMLVPPPQALASQP